ncbi:hypothetical protein ACFY1P_08295 [Streptomyces sp. NPDC001407]|uniref:hypothetical protein n=1 Tax=Streptomyces sp. NPDC001407 TaxID=3364573 RepID=UPI00367513D9
MDPFATDNPWESNSRPVVETPNKENPMHVADAEAFTITLKYGGGYDAPWVVVRAGDAETAKTRIKEAQEAGLLEMVAKAGSHVSGLFDSPSKAPASRPAAKAAQTASPESGDDCPHGRKLVDKGSWAAKFCSAPDKSAQCEPLWRQKDGSFKRGK